jgi:hypothetical protein
MAETTNEGPPVPAPHTGGGDPARPRYLGLWVAGILFFTLCAGAMGVVTDVLYKLALQAMGQ